MFSVRETNFVCHITQHESQRFSAMSLLTVHVRAAPRAIVLLLSSVSRVALANGTMHSFWAGFQKCLASWMND